MNQDPYIVPPFIFSSGKGEKDSKSNKNMFETFNPRMAYMGNSRCSEHKKMFKNISEKSSKVGGSGSGGCDNGGDRDGNVANGDGG